MTYRSLLTVFTDTTDFEPTLEAAIVLARHHDAHLEVLCTGLGRNSLAMGFTDINGTALLAAMEDSAAQSAALATRARTRLERDDIRWSVADTGVQVLSTGQHVAVYARYADLVVLPRPLGPDRGTEAEEVVEAALFGGQAPVLVIPPTGLTDGAMRRVVVAWDGGNEAMAAVRAALPLLAAAEAVSIAVVDPRRLHHEIGDPGGAVARYLVRHRVDAEVSVLASTSARISEVLNQHVRDRNADLLVMGAYGHARLREILIGGTTRDMLRDAVVPVLLAR